MKKIKRSLFTIQSGLLLILYIVICLLIFSINSKREISKTVQSNLTNNINLQSQNIEKLIDQQVNSMKSLADYIGKQSELVNESSMTFMNSFVENSFLTRIYVIDEHGNAHFNSGNVINVADREYFKLAMSGETTIAQPVKYILEDKYRIIMAVPIISNGEIKGVLGASFDLSDLSNVLYYSYEYRKIGYSLVINTNGDLISIEDDKADIGDANFFKFYKTATFEDYSQAQVRKLLKQDKAVCLKATKDNEGRYIAIAPLDFNDWLIVYIIPTTIAENQYAFIGDNQMVLFLESGLGIVGYLAYIFKKTRKQQKKLIKQASLDQLTGLYNKITIQKMIEEKINNDEATVIMLIDLDDFKAINDNYGHLAGDEVLIRVSQCIKNAIRKDDIAGRIGGDEIMIMFKDVEDENGIKEKCNELIKRISGIEFEPGFSVSCSIGIASYPKNAKSFEELYRKADEALYKAKDTGKNGFHIV